VYPKEINFGDVFFSTITVSNNSNFPVACTTLATENVGNLKGSIVGLNGVYYRFYGYWAYFEGEQGTSDFTRRNIGPCGGWWGSETDIIIPNSKNEFFMKTLFWLPLPAPPGDTSADRLRKSISSGQYEYFFQPDAFVKMVLFSGKDKNDGKVLFHRYWDNDKVKHVVDEKGIEEKLKTKIIIKPRDDNILNSLRSWYVELPIYEGVLPNNLFVTNAYANDSPIRHIVANYNTIEKDANYNLIDIVKLQSKYDCVILRDARALHRENRQNFELSMRTRTPKLLYAIHRTNERAKWLLKLPDSELSQNMKEFIQLRGLLVDIRFAEDEKAEEIAFNELITFVNKAKDKKLWIKFVGEIAFDSLHDDKYFPHKKIDTYRKRWIEKFEDKTEVKEVSKK
jgi:hypothetical protein